MAPPGQEPGRFPLCSQCLVQGLAHSLPITLDRPRWMGPCSCGHQLEMTAALQLNAGFAVSPRKRPWVTGILDSGKEGSGLGALADTERGRRDGGPFLTRPGWREEGEPRAGGTGGGGSAESPYSKSGQGDSWPNTSAWPTRRTGRRGRRSSDLRDENLGGTLSFISVGARNIGPTRTDQSREERVSPSRQAGSGWTWPRS